MEAPCLFPQIVLHVSLTLIPFFGENINTITYNFPDIFLYLHISLNTNGTVQFV